MHPLSRQLPPRPALVVLLGLTACLGLAAGGTGAAAAAADLDAAAAADLDAAAAGWLRADSEHFVLFGDAPRADLVEAATTLERLREVLIALAPQTDVDAGPPTHLYLFRDDASFAPFRISSVEAGYLLPGEQRSYAAFRGGNPSPLVIEQYVHELLNRHLPGLPPWLRDGMAEYYSTFEADAEEARLGLPQRGHLFFFANDRAGSLGALRPMAELLAAEGPPGGSGRERAAWDGQCWAAVHLLMAGDAGKRRRIADYIRRVQGGSDPVAAFPAAFGMGPAAFDEELADYVKGRSFTFLRVAVPAAAGYEVALSPLQPAEALFRQADLLLAIGPLRREAAGERLRRAVELDPDHALAWAGLGRLAEAAGDEPLALAHYGRAAELAPESYPVQLACARARLRRLGGRSPQDESAEAMLGRAREGFRRAVELEPAAGAAWAGLGEALLLGAEPDPEAATALERAVELLARGRTDVLYNLLLARARTADLDGVEEAEARLRERGAEDALLAQARHLRLQVTLKEAHRLATSERLDDAVALLAAARAEARDPALAEQAEMLLERVARAAVHNRFAEGYSEAVRLYRAGELSAAAERVDEMLAEARPGRQVEVLEELRELIRSGEGEG